MSGKSAPKIQKKKIAAKKTSPKKKEPPVDFSKKPTLRPGSRGSYVVDIQNRLRASGGSLDIDGAFGSQTSEAVREFQMQHYSEGGLPLDVDGIVGKQTWWALYNSTAASQRSGIGSEVHHNTREPGGLSDKRERFLDALWEAYALDIKEEPDGSNWGGHVAEILENAGGPRPWCAHAISWVWKKAFGSYPGKDHGHVLTWWREATREGKAHEIRDGYQPKPGDLGVMLYKRNGVLTGSGHIFAVLANNGAAMNTMEGNVGNRMKVGMRYQSQSTLVGFINLFGDSDVPATLQKVVKAEKLASSHSATR